MKTDEEFIQKIVVETGLVFQCIDMDVDYLIFDNPEKIAIRVDKGDTSLITFTVGRGYRDIKEAKSSLQLLSMDWGKECDLMIGAFYFTDGTVLGMEKKCSNLKDLSQVAEVVKRFFSNKNEVYPNLVLGDYKESEGVVNGM